MRAESPELAAARRRMIEANDRLGRVADRDPWDAWQRAATDYWLLLHPELEPWRRGDPTRTLRQDEIARRAELIERSTDDVPEDWRLRRPSEDGYRHMAQVGWFHEAMAGLYEPVDHALSRVRAGDRSGMETLIRFLEADPYCHRSGYTKATIIQALKRQALQPSEAARLRAVVIDVVRSHDRREFRAYCRLARAVDAPELRVALRELAWRPFDDPVERRARWVLEALGERAPRS